MRKLMIAGILILMMMTASIGETLTVFILGDIQHGKSFNVLKRDINYGMLSMALKEQKIEDIVVVIASQGGSVYEALLMYDFIVGLRKYGRTVYTVASSHCMSAGVLILQAGQKRYATEFTQFMTHRPLIVLPPNKDPNFMTEDKFKELRKSLVRVQETQLKLMIKRTGKPRWFLKKYFTDDMYFFNSDEAYQIGLIDFVLIDPITPMSRWIPRKKSKSFLIVPGSKQIAE